MVVLILAGAVFLIGGAVTILLGLPVKEFSFGNTLILAGAVAGCTGAILLGLAALVRELRSVRHLLEAGHPIGISAGAAPAVVPILPDVEPIVPDSSGSPKLDSRAGDALAISVPGSDDTPPGEERREPVLETPPEPPPKPRRNLLFSSTSRRERERAAAKGEAAAASEPPRPVPGSVLSEAPPVIFDENRSGAAPRRERTPPTFAEPAAPSSRPPQPAEPTPQVTVLKSGVVDGMAYSLYSDGSIEAQLPEGMMRFASIDELRSYLDARP